MGLGRIHPSPPGSAAMDASQSRNGRCDRSGHRQGNGGLARSGIRQPGLSQNANEGGPCCYADRMNHIHISTIHALVSLSFALCALAFVPDLTFAAPGCNLERDRDRADLDAASLIGANLSSATLSLAQLSFAVLIGANLRGATLSGANLEGAFRRPGISRADLEGATGLDTVKGLVD